MCSICIAIFLSHPGVNQPALLWNGHMEMKNMCVEREQIRSSNCSQHAHNTLTNNNTCVILACMQGKVFPWTVKARHAGHQPLEPEALPTRISAETCDWQKDLWREGDQIAPLTSKALADRG